MLKQNRFEYIETQLFWGDGLTARSLKETFDISRQAAQKVIDDYRKAFPGQMEYNASRRCHEASESFKPVFIKPDSLLFLDYLRGQTLAGYYREEHEWSDLEVIDINRHLRPKLLLKPIKTVISAVHRKQVVIIDYHQKDLEPDTTTTRLISPHHIVFADNRYHVRAYCHDKHYYLDFVLSRIVYAEMTTEEWVSSKGDKDWNEWIELHFIPNPELPGSVQEAIIRNYETPKSGIRIIRCRKALALYIERKLLSKDYKYKISLWILIKG